MRTLLALLGLVTMLAAGAITTAQEQNAADGSGGGLDQIEAQARDLTAHGARSEAVYALQRALDRYQDAPARERIEADLRLFSLEGRRAPPLQAGVRAGARLPAADELHGKVVLLFFWAHWCSDCKAESSVVEAIVDKYRGRDLVFIAPTQRYGYGAEGRSAAPDKELRHIVEVRDLYYRFMRTMAVPVSEANYQQYGVASIPTHVVIDREGIIRLYRPGRMTAEELDAVIQPLL
jgi:thiol-disulfide isomerase/thioredoxin